MNTTPQLSSSPLIKWPLAFAVGSVVRQKLHPDLTGTIVRYSGVPALWYVQWNDGTCRLCNSLFLEELPAFEPAPTVLSPTP